MDDSPDLNIPARDPDMPDDALGLGLVEPAIKPKAEASSPYRVLARKYRPQNFAELIEAARQREIPYATPGIGTVGHLAGQMLNVATVQGANIAINAMGGVRINDTATVIQADITADNGVIHVIDVVLLPPTN